MRLWKRGYRHQRVPRRSSSADRRPHTGPRQRTRERVHVLPHPSYHIGAGRREPRQRTRERVHLLPHPFPTYGYGRWSERGGTAKKLKLKLAARRRRNEYRYGICATGSIRPCGTRRQASSAPSARSSCWIQSPARTVTLTTGATSSLGLPRIIPRLRPGCRCPLAF